MLVISLFVPGNFHLVRCPGMAPHPGEIKGFLTNLTVGYNHVLHIRTQLHLLDFLLVILLMVNHRLLSSLLSTNVAIIIAGRRHAEIADIRFLSDFVCLNGIFIGTNTAN